MRYEQFDDAHNHILAVGDVCLSSPAHQAHLVPFKDYILGTREKTFKNLQDFATLIQVNALPETAEEPAESDSNSSDGE